MREDLEQAWLLLGALLLVIGFAAGIVAHWWATQSRHECMPHDANYCRDKYLSRRPSLDQRATRTETRTFHK